MRIEARPFISTCIDSPPPPPPDATAPSTKGEDLQLERVRLAKPLTPTAPVRCPAPTRDPGPPEAPPRTGSPPGGVVAGVLRGIGAFFRGLLSAPRAIAIGLATGGREAIHGRIGAAFAAVGLGVASAAASAVLHAGAGIVLAARRGGRPLSPDEAATVRNALGPKARTDLIRIVEGGSILNAGNVAITIGHTIFVSKKALPLAPDLLVHEATHTRQYDAIGPAYLLKALAAQHDRDGYDFRKALDRGETFPGMNLESQAEFLQQIEASGFDASDPKARAYAAPSWMPPGLSTRAADYGGEGMDVTEQARRARRR